MLSKLVPVTYQAEFLFLGVEEKKKKRRNSFIFLHLIQGGKTDKAVASQQEEH